MNYDALQRLREPVAWALVVAAGLQVIAGLISLFAASSFSAQAFVEVNLGNVLTGGVLAGIVVAAVLLATRGETPSPQARIITIAGLAVLAIATLFGVIVWLAALGANAEVIGVGSTEKFAVFLYGAGKVIVLGVAAYVTYTVLQALQPARHVAQPGAVPPGQEGYQAYGYPQGDQQQYGGYPQPQAPEYGQQPQGYGQQYQQPYQQQPYAPGQQDYQQPQQQPPYGHGQAPQDYAQPDFAQPDYAQPPREQQPYGQQSQPPQGYSAQPPVEGAEGEGEAGLWTRSYGSEQPQAPGYPQSGEENDQNWYRDDRRSP